MKIETMKTETVTDYLGSDHRRLDKIMQRCGASVESGDMKQAASLFDEFHEGLKRHIKIEEGLLFPAFEAATETDRSSGPTGVMRSEHEEILRLMGLLKEHFSGESPTAAGFETLRGKLVFALKEHNLKEERVLYPTTDRELSSERLHELVGRMRSF